MQGIAVQELRVGIDRPVHAAATDDALTGSLQLTICQKHRREGGGGQDAPVGLHLRLLELQQTVSGVGDHVSNRGTEDRQVGAVVSRAASARVLVHRSLKEVWVGDEHPSGFQAAHGGGELHLSVGVVGGGGGGLDGAHCPQRIRHLRIANQGKWEGHLLCEHGSAGSHQGVGGVEAVKRELHTRAHAEKEAFSREAFLIVATTRVIRTDHGSVGDVSSAHGPAGSNQQSLVVETHVRT
mmetsp:Transcript_43476/g.75590  ORF Transcript_43476/g.75590 Transcript_43476/m.75590 type:complete len:239 (+) Transcript_43476:925-1641(+)